MATTSIYRPAGAGISLWRALLAEMLKMKRTLAFWLTLVAPAVVVSLNTLVYIQRGQTMVIEGPEGSAWAMFYRQMLIFWTLLMLPLFITLETALVAQLDHSGNHWKQLYALPVPRWAIYLAKQLASSLLIGLSMVMLHFYILLGGLVMRLVKTGVGFETAPDLGRWPWAAVLVFISAWLIISLHTFIAMRWQSFTIASAAGIFATIAGILIVNSDYSGFYPWTMSALMVFNIGQGQPYQNYLLAGGLGGLLAALVGCWMVTRRDVL